MKRYISAILVPGLLLQLCGCYSMREMTLEELKNFTGSDDLIIKTNQKEVLINRKSDKNSSMNWEANDSTITVQTTEPITLENYNKLSKQEYTRLIIQTTEIKFNEIETTKIKEYDDIKNLGIAVGFFAAWVLITGAVFFKWNSY